MSRESRAKDIFDYVDKHGIEKTITDFDISYETVTRNIRRYKQFIKGEATDARLPKILLLDIETLPLWTRVWGLYKQRIPHGNIVKIGWFYLGQQSC